MRHAGAGPVPQDFAPALDSDPVPGAVSISDQLLEALTSANPLVAREGEVERLVDVVRSGGSALVIGESGTGKTATVAQALAALRSRPGAPRVVTIHASSQDQSSLDRALAPLVDRLPADANRNLTEALRHAAGDDPLVLRVEDAHLLDDDSRSQLGWWVRQNDFSIIATMRSAAGASWPWMELWRNRSVERIDVCAFDQAQVQQYLESVLDGPVSVAVGWRLRLITAGVPERVATVVSNERRRGQLRRIDGVWHWGGGALPDSRLIEVVHSDLESLDAASRSALELLAAIGPVPESIVRGVAPPGALQVLQHRGLITTSLAQEGPHLGEFMTAVMHPLYAETVKLGLSRERSADLFSCVCHLIDDPQLPDSLLPPLVAFGLRSGVQVRPDAVRAAVDQLFRTSLGDPAVSLIDDALQLGTDDEIAAELLMYRALSMRRQGDPVRAVRDLERMDVLIRSLGSPPLLAVRAAMAHADHLHFAAEEPEVALEILESAVATAREAAAAGELPPAMVEIAELTHLGHALWAGQRGDRIQQALEVLEARPQKPEALLLVAPVVLNQALAGRPEAALRIAARHRGALEAAFETTPLALILTSMVTMVVSLWAGGYTKDRAFDPGVVTDTDGAWRQFIRGFESMSEAVWSAAEPDLHAYEVSLQHHDPAGLRSYVSSTHALAAAAAGDRGHARDLIESSALLPRGRWAVLESEMRLLRLDALMWLGDDAMAIRARELVDWAREQGDHRAELEALHRVCLVESRVGGVHRPALLDRLRELQSLTDGRRNALLVMHAESLILGDGQLAQVHERELAGTGLWLAPVRSAPAESLTQREREVAQLAAGGMSSKAIAGRLFLSVRTVDTHLARAYAKFGVHSRDELAGVLRRQAS